MLVYKVSEALSCIRGGKSSFPYYLIPEITSAENCIHKELQIMASGGVAVEVNRASIREHSFQF